jgi:hypothetical protein
MSQSIGRKGKYTSASQVTEIRKQHVQAVLYDPNRIKTRGSISIAEVKRFQSDLNVFSQITGAGLAAVSSDLILVVFPNSQQSSGPVPLPNLTSFRMQFQQSAVNYDDINGFVFEASGVDFTGASVSIPGTTIVDVVGQPDNLTVTIASATGFSASSIIEVTLPTAIPQFDNIYLGTL